MAAQIQTGAPAPNLDFYLDQQELRWLPRSMRFQDPDAGTPHPQRRERFLACVMSQSLLEAEDQCAVELEEPAEVQCGGLKDRFKLKDTHQINSNLYCWEMCSALRRKSRLLPTLVTQQPNSMGIFGRHLHHTLFRDFYDPRVKREWWQTHALMFMSTGLRELGQGIQAGRFQAPPALLTAINRMANELHRMALWASSPVSAQMQTEASVTDRSGDWRMAPDHLDDEP